jgi:hypothetical protein
VEIFQILLCYADNKKFRFLLEVTSSLSVTSYLFFLFLFAFTTNPALLHFNTCANKTMSCSQKDPSTVDLALSFIFPDLNQHNLTYIQAIFPGIRNHKINCIHPFRSNTNFNDIILILLLLLLLLLLTIKYQLISSSKYLFHVFLKKHEKII